MSDLQLGLILVGVLIVVAVYAFNRYQERQFRRRIEARFQEQTPAADPLLDEAIESRTEERIEPHLGEPAADTAPAEPAGPSVSQTPRQSEASPRDSDDASATHAAQSPVEATEPALSLIDYVCDIETAEPIASAVLNEFLKAVNSIGKPVQVIGWNPRSNEWLALPSSTDISPSRIQVALQLADRSGPINRVQLSSMRDLAHQFAERVGGVSECPQIDMAAQTAQEIDRFCAQVDISIGCHVVPNSSGGLSGTKVRGLLESAGFVLESSGRFVLRADDGAVMLAAESMDGEAMSADRLRAGPVPGLTLTMDVPRVPAGTRVFDRMLELGRQLAHALDATVVDDNRTRLSDAGIKVIRQQLRNVQAAMEAQGIPAGGALAARLFS